MTGRMALLIHKTDRQTDTQTTPYKALKARSLHRGKIYNQDVNFSVVSNI